MSSVEQEVDEETAAEKRPWPEVPLPQQMSGKRCAAGSEAKASAQRLGLKSASVHHPAYCWGGVKSIGRTIAWEKVMLWRLVAVTIAAVVQHTGNPMAVKASIMAATYSVIVEVSSALLEATSMVQA